MLNNLREIHSCEVCGSSEMASVLDLGHHPLCDDLILIGQQRVCDTYPIEILFCSKCNTAHQRFQVAKKKLFPNSYHYRSKNTADVLDGMKDFVKTCENKFGKLSNIKVIDIGCNDGSLLNFFREKGAQTYGIEPTDAYQDAAMEGHAVMNAYLTQEVAQSFVSEYGHADIITFTNVFAHIEDLEELLKSINVLRQPNTSVVIENHYLGSILERKQFDTFYHEHPRTYSCKSFIQVAKKLGMSIDSVEFPRRYGGNIRVFMRPARGGEKLSDHQKYIIKNENSSFMQAFKDLASYINRWRVEKKAEILTAVKVHGPLLAKAFPGRAAIPVQMLDIDHNSVKAAYEKPGSQKINHWIPGTRIPIMSDIYLLADNCGESPILNLAWHIDDEINTYLRNLGYNGRLINII